MTKTLTPKEQIDKLFHEPEVTSPPKDYMLADAFATDGSAAVLVASSEDLDRYLYEHFDYEVSERGRVYDLPWLKWRSQNDPGQSLPDGRFCILLTGFDELPVVPFSDVVSFLSWLNVWGPLDPEELDAVARPGVQDDSWRRGFLQEEGYPEDQDAVTDDTSYSHNITLTKDAVKYLERCNDF